MTTHKRTKAAPSDDAVLRTLLKRWEAELEYDVRLFAELPAKIEEKKKKIAAIKVVVSNGFHSLPAIIEAKQEKQAPAVEEKPAIRRIRRTRRKVTWSSTVLRILDDNNGGLTHQEILQAAIKTPLGERRSAGDKGFYNAVGRLVKNRQIVKHGRLLYSAKVARQLQARGEKLPDAPVKAGGSSGLVLDLLRSRPDGLAAPDIQRILKDNPSAPASIRDHKHYVYNLLATLIGKGLVIRSEDSIYRAK